MNSPLQDRIASVATPLPPISSPEFGGHFSSFGSYRVVLLGDASHGTSEFYQARAEITKHLITHHRFNIVAIEGDYPDAETVDRYIRQRPGPQAAIRKTESTTDEQPFKRFPTWMWRNAETQSLVEWLRDWNADLPKEKRTGFYGLDLYSLGSSMRAIIDYLERVDPEMAKTARSRYGCLQPWVEDPQQYGLVNYKLDNMRSCEQAVVGMLRDLLAKRLQYSADTHDGEEFHSSEQNAYVVRDAEMYYKAMYYSSALSWSLRDTHMFGTLERLLRSKGKGAKAVVWAHNSHVGDARFTSMGTRNKELNVGQLCRERLGRENVGIIGCGTHTGTVAAAHEWDEDMQVMNVRPSRSDSWENLAHQTKISSFLLDLRESVMDREMRAALMKERRLERFIGVIYRPETERWSHYSEANLPEQLDAYVWFDETRAVQPLERVQPRTALGTEETYPFGL